jgi:hypothetical protein
MATGVAMPATTDQDSYSAEGKFESLHTQAQYTDGDPISDDDAHSSSKRDKLRMLKAKTKAKTKAILHIDNGEPLLVEADRENGGALSGVVHDPAFNPTQVTEDAIQQARDARSPVNKTKGTLEAIGGYIAHPRASIKSKAQHTTAGTISGLQQPQLSQGPDQNLLDAHSDLADIEERRASPNASSDKEEYNVDIDGLKDEITRLEESRDSMRIAWTTKHVNRARVVRRRFSRIPERDTFMERDENGESIGYNWIKWLGYFLLYHTQDFTAQYMDDFEELPFDIDK